MITAPPPPPPPHHFIVKSHSSMSYLIRDLGPVDTYPNIYEDGVFYSVMASCPPVNSVFQAPETQVFENGPKSGAFF